MALKAGSTPVKPDIACVGSITEVGDSTTSKGGNFEVIKITLKGKHGGKDGDFWFTYEPRWFGKTFDPESLLNELYTSKSGSTYSPYGMYRQTICDAKRPAALQSLCGIVGEGDGPSGFDQLVQAVESAPAEVIAEDVSNLLRKYAVGNDVGYIMTQGEDEDGSLRDSYNVQYFFPLTEESVAAVVKQSKNPKRRRGPLVVTWDEEVAARA